MRQKNSVAQVDLNGFLENVEERLSLLEARMKANGDVIESEVETAVKLMQEIKDLVKKRKIENDPREA